MINLSYARGLHQYHAESFYRVLVVFLAIPLVYDLLDSSKLRKWLIYLLPFIVFIRLINISARHDIFADRIEWHQNLLTQVDQLEERKFVLYHENAPEGKPEISWSTPFVTSLLSSLNNPDSTCTILLTKKGHKVFEQYKRQNDVFIGPFEGWKFSDFNTTYFNFDVRRPYRILNSNDLK